MSRLDQHVSAVRNKLAIEKFIIAIAWALLIFAAACLLVIVVNRAFQWTLPKLSWWFYGGLGVSLLSAIVIAMLRRPDQHAAAVAIDQKLGLKEKFSTALSIRRNGSVERNATRNPTHSTAANSPITSSAPTAPSSSPMTAKMKSL